MKLRPLLVLLVGILVSACGKSPTTPGTTTTFQGVIAGSSGQSGTLAVTVQAQVAAAFVPRLQWPFVATLQAQATSVAATGTLHLVGGATTDLTGTFDTSSKALSLSGGGFALTGSLNGAVVSGTYTGSGGVTGRFSSLSASSGTVTTYCGTIFSSGQGSVATGVFNVEVLQSSGAMSGAFNVLPNNAGTITGQVTGTAFTITYVDSTGSTGGGSGTIQNGALNGVSTSTNPFSGSTSACQ